MRRALVLARAPDRDRGNGVRVRTRRDDPAVTLRNSVTAGIKEILVELQQAQHRQLRRMARRLCAVLQLGKVCRADPPRWRTRRPGEFLYDGAYNAALTFGDPSGMAYLDVTEPVLTAQQLLSGSIVHRSRGDEARLATVDAADAAAIAATNDTGQLRFNGRKYELQAIDALEATVIDPSDEQSATAVLDKISGAVLIGARQRQARAQLLTGDRRAAARGQQTGARYGSGGDEHAARHLAGRPSGERGVRRRNWRRPADLASAVATIEDRHAPQPSLNLVPTVQQAISEPADDVRAGVPALRVQALPRRSRRS